jgi:hypothetical protein
MNDESIMERRRETVAKSRAIFTELESKIESMKTSSTIEWEKVERDKIAKYCEKSYQEMAHRAVEIAGYISSVGEYIKKYRTPKYPDLYQVNMQMTRLRDAIDIFEKNTK